ncbi:phosphoglycolate phosphatase 1 [Geobacter sp. OR-1]|uniref:HAD family hydrolase n=1 Tax=Geobacter sp. OR-1 TaxID=1266765 RepID=UPI000542405E|nr:HAD-IA family hydrolase [Geobacter sp. OR-1]GAM11092.1 phosphoglycolate phosphatase 1 [Geobacter sp. OR-1]
MFQPVNPWGASKPPSLVIFDLDGTLVNSLEDLAMSVNFMRGNFGLPPIALEDVRRAIGKGARNLVTRTMPENDGRINEALSLFLEHNGSNLAVHSRLYPGARELLAALNSSGIPLGLVSNKNSAHCELLLSSLGIADSFRTILGGDAVKECKPSPAPLLETLSRTGSTAETTVMIGDSINDFEAAFAAGVRSIGCKFGYGESWEVERATVRIDSLEELLPLPWSAQG